MSTVSFCGVAYSTSSAMGKELMKWEKPHNWNAADHVFPKMLYKAQKRHDGKVMCMESNPSPFGWINDAQYERECDRVLAFNRSCQMVVNDEQDQKRAEADGWRETVKDALEAHEKWERMMGDEAARLAHADRNLSAAAKKEREAADAATHEHLVEVPEKPTVKRGRPRKEAAAA